MLAMAYAASFGVELLIHNIAASYYVDRFGFSIQSAGFAAGIFGAIALFGRAFGGLASDRIALTRGLDGRTSLLFICMLGEGIGLLFFSSASSAGPAIVAMAIFGVFTHMSCGAIYAVSPFIDRKALGGVSGLIGAGGNVGAVAAGFLNKAAGTPQQTLWLLGWIVLGISLCAIAVRFSAEKKSSEQQLLDAAIAERNAFSAARGMPVPSA
jgi:NNP family nitrate/nitrite transporter-like MFS transporter